MSSQDLTADTITPADRLEAPAAARNRAPILAALESVLPKQGQALEIASGSGEHVLHFAKALSDWHWQPSDPDPGKLRSIAAWCQDHKKDNIATPLHIDASTPDWPLQAKRYDLVLVINMFHVAPIEATTGFFREAAKCLNPGGIVISYGPYLRDHGYASQGDAAFDARLQAENPQWGYRSLQQIDTISREHGLNRHQTLEMPANNLMLVFGR